jgi:hypothetical protein
MPAVASRGSATLDAGHAGATGDGVTDDGPAINAALQRLAQHESGVLHLPAGHYITNEPILVDTNAVGIQGDGLHEISSPGGTVISAGPGFADPGVIGFEPAVLKLVNKNPDGRPLLGSFLRDFRVGAIGGGLGPAGVHGIYMRSARGDFERLMTDHNGGSGIFIEGARNGVDGATVNWDTYDTVFSRIQSGWNGEHGMHCDDTGVADLHVTNGIFFDNELDGAWMRGSSSQFTACHFYDNRRNNVALRQIRQWLIGCKIEGAGQHGVLAEAVGASSTFYGQFIMVGNGFKGNGMDAANTYDSLHIVGDVNDGGFVLTGNRFSKFESTPRFALHLASGGITQGIVSGNGFMEIDGTWGTGPLGTGGSAAQDFKVEFGYNGGLNVHQVGLETITASQTVVTHGQDVQPDPGEIFATFNSWPAGITELYIDQITATDFRINAFPAPSQAVDVAWHIHSQGPEGPAGT